GEARERWREGDVDLDGGVVGGGGGAGIAQIAGQLVLVAKHVAGGAGRVALGAEGGVVEETAALGDLLRLGVEHLNVGDLLLLLRADDGDAVVEAGHDVELSATLV